MTNLNELRNMLFKQQRGLGGCDKFKGDEDIKGLIDLFDSIEGRLFCARKRWPSLDDVRQLKGYDLLRFGVYLDEGDVELVNPERVIIAGDTNATLRYSNPAAYALNIQYGAKVTIHANNFAVVDLFAAEDCEITEMISGNAKIIHTNKLTMKRK